MLLAVFVLTLLQIVLGLIFGIEEDLRGMGWILLSNLLIVVILAYTIVRSESHGLKLAGTVFLMFFGIYVFNTQIEALFFQLQIPRIETIKMISEGLLVALLISPAIVFLMNRMQKPVSNVESFPRPHLSIIGYVWRFILCDVSYVILYCIAGAIILPYVQDFYSDLAQTPALGKILIMQLLRGLIYVIVVLPVIRMINAKRLEIALLVGLQLSVLGGIAPLLPPNPYMPPEIRLVHGIEIGISNFIYGAIIGFLFKSKVKG
jgi:hypothetical protein